MTASDNAISGRRRLLRSLLAVAQEPVQVELSTGTQQLGSVTHPGVSVVTDVTFRAIDHMARTQANWDTRLLFGNQHSMTVSQRLPGADPVIDVRSMLTDSLRDLKDGHTVLASDKEARKLVSELDMSPDATLVYLVPMTANSTLGGLIVVGVNSGMSQSMLDSLHAVAMQSGLLLETLQVTEGLRQRESGLRALVQNASDILLVVHPNMAIVDLAPTSSGLLGYTTDELLGQQISNFLHPHDVKPATQAVQAMSTQRGASAALHWRMRRKDGSWMHVEVVGNNLLDNPGVAGIVLSARDISERKALEANILHQVLHDELTGLPNRTAFMNLLENGLARSRHGATSLAVLFLDLDRFKIVNDSLGHEAGDQLLIQVARRLRESVRTGDVVARLSGDEFVVMINDITSPEPAIDVAEKILYRLKDAIRIDTHEVFVSTSIGIALESASNSTASATSVLRNADLAMYETKNGGRSGYTVYHPQMSAKAVDRLALETELRYAVTNGEFQVFYQPLIDLRTGRVDEVEALVRWMHPSRGLLLPDSFIALAEETGLIEPIGQWVLEEACRQSRLWAKQRPSAPPLRLNVNLSVRQFQQRGLVTEVQRVLRSSGIDPHQLTLEITESVALDDADAAVATMRELKKLGIKLALDDFGTGYSALSYLKKFPVDSLKIDRSFIEGLNYDDGDVAIVKAVIAFAKTLNLRVTAEGVETPDQLRRVKMLGCDVGQGYFFATPLPGMDLALDSHFGTQQFSIVNNTPPQEPLIVPRRA